MLHVAKNMAGPVLGVDYYARRLEHTDPDDESILTDNLLLTDADPNKEYTAELILAERTLTGAGGEDKLLEYLIKWQDYNVIDSTWEPASKVLPCDKYFVDEWEIEKKKQDAGLSRAFPVEVWVEKSRRLEYCRWLKRKTSHANHDIQPQKPRPVETGASASNDILADLTKTKADAKEIDDLRQPARQSNSGFNQMNSAPRGPDLDTGAKHHQTLDTVRTLKESAEDVPLINDQRAEAIRSPIGSISGDSDDDLPLIQLAQKRKSRVTGSASEINFARTGCGNAPPRETLSSVATVQNKSIAHQKNTQAKFLIRVKLRGTIFALYCHAGSSQGFSQFFSGTVSRSFTIDGMYSITELRGLLTGTLDYSDWGVSSCTDQNDPATTWSDELKSKCAAYIARDANRVLLLHSRKDDEWFKLFPVRESGLSHSTPALRCVTLTLDAPLILPNETEMLIPRINPVIDLRRFLAWEPTNSMCSKTAFLWFDDTESTQRDAISKQLGNHGVAVHFPGAGSWERFVAHCSSGLVLFGPNFRQFWALHGLPDKVERRFNFFEFRRPETNSCVIGPPPTRIFKEHRAICLSDECFQEHPARTSKVFKLLDERIRRQGPLSTKIITRPSLVSWLEELWRGEHLMSPAHEPREQLCRNFSLMVMKHNKAHDYRDGDGTPLTPPPIISPPSDWFVNYSSEYKRYPMETKQRLIAFFSDWAIKNRYFFRKFMYITTEKEGIVMDWAKKHGHIQFLTPDVFLQQETKRKQVPQVINPTRHS